MGKRPEALPEFERAVHLDPEHLVALCDHGIALLNLGRLEEALDKFEAVISKNRSFAKAWFCRGIVLINGRMSLQEGIRSLKYAESLGSKDATEALRQLDNS
jgi:tetratricopeptide (TPR) repeat protein